MNARELPQEIRYTIDLKDNLVRQAMRGKLVKNDRAANKVVVSIVDGKEEVDLSGVAVTGGFVRPGDSAEILLSGSADGNEASVTLADACYEQAGTIEIFIRLSLGGITRTILTLTGDVIPKGSGAYVDITGAIPSVEDIIEQYAEMQAVTQRTIAAAQRAENLVIDANGLAGDANRLGGKPPEYYIQSKDLLVNSDFTKPVNQRGKKTTNKNGYFIDRWTAYSEAGATYTIVDDGLKIDTTSLSSAGTISQYIPKLKDGNYTAAIYDTSGNVLGVRRYTVADGKCTLQGGELNGGLVVLWYSQLSGANVFELRCEAGNTVTFAKAALYEGSYTADTIPPYVPKGYTVELAECRRYFIPLISPTFLGFVIMDSNGTSFQGYTHGNEMNIIRPTVNVAVKTWDGANAHDATIADFVWLGNGYRITGTVSTNVSGGTVLSLYAESNGSIDADL